MTQSARPALARTTAALPPLEFTDWFEFRRLSRGEDAADGDVVDALEEFPSDDAAYWEAVQEWERECEAARPMTILRRVHQAMKAGDVPRANLRHRNGSTISVVNAGYTASWSGVLQSDGQRGEGTRKGERYVIVRVYPKKPVDRRKWQTQIASALRQAGAVFHLHAGDYCITGWSEAEH